MPKRKQDEITMVQLGENGGKAGVLPTTVYRPGKVYTAAQNNRQNQETPKSTTYTTGGGNQQYIDQLNSLYGKIMNRGPFSYDLNGDMLYRQMADRYTQLGKDAMRDTMGQAAALTGGYGNSYAQQVGNQAYQQYLASLNDQIPALYEQAYNVWQGEGERLMQLYQLAAAHPEYLAALSPRTYTVKDEEEADGKTGEQTGDGNYEQLLNAMGLSTTGAMNGAMAAASAQVGEKPQNALENWYYTLLNMRK